MWKLLAVFSFVVVLVSGSAEPEDKCVGAACHASQGLQFIGKFVRNYLESQPSDLVLTEGVHLVAVGGNDADPQYARAANDNSLVTSVVNFLRRHELKIKLPELMPDSESMSRTFNEVMEDFKNNEIGGISSTRQLIQIISNEIYN